MAHTSPVKPRSHPAVFDDGGRAKEHACASPESSFPSPDRGKRSPPWRQYGPRHRRAKTDPVPSWECPLLSQLEPCTDFAGDLRKRVHLPGRRFPGHPTQRYPHCAPEHGRGSGGKAGCPDQHKTASKLVHLHPLSRRFPRQETILASISILKRNSWRLYGPLLSFCMAASSRDLCAPGAWR